MRFQRKKLAVALAYALGAGGAVTVLSGPVFAQPAPAPTTQYKEKISVTGTHIPTISGETALPVQVITADQIAREGIQSAAALVERLSVNSTTGAITLASTEGNTGAGQSSASLRGLGAQRTLVLLNGRRLAVSGFNGGSVDINSIPLSGIERVEVLTDGASAIYGSDAIAGVINFIMRSVYQGAEASAYYGDSTHGGGWVQRYSGTAGYGDLVTQKFNVFATVDYSEFGGLKAAQRSFSASAYRPDLGLDKTSGRSIPANVGTPSGSRNPFAPQCAPPFSFVTTNPRQCRFDYASVIDIIPPQQMTNVLGKATWQINADNQLYVEGLYADNKVQSRVSPSPVDPATVFNPQGQPLLLPPTSPFYPHAFAQANGIDGQPLQLNWRSLPEGPRAENDEVKQGRAALGAKGTLWNWDYDMTGVWNQNKSYSYYPSGWLFQSKLFPIFATGKIDPFSVQLPQDQLDLLAPAVVNQQIINSKAQTNGFNFVASRDIWSLPAGQIAMAVGGDYFHNTYEFNAAPEINSGDIVGTGGTLTSTNASRNNWDIFAEFNIPLLKGLEVSAAVRYDDYKDVGSTTNPKVSVRWTPMSAVLLRGSWGTGFRAPTLSELFQPPFVSATGGNYTDPQRCPVTNAVVDCNVQFNDLIGGNPNLKPEKSTQWGLGGIWEPVPGNSLGIDYWNIKVDNVVGVLGEQNLFGNTGEKIPASVAAGLIIRNPQTPQDVALGIPGSIKWGLLTNLNIQKLQVDGLDFTIKVRGPALDWGQITGSYLGTYYINWKQTDLDTGRQVNYVGQSVGGVASVTAGPGFPASLPRYKHNIALNWNLGPWAATLTNVFQDSYTDNSGTRNVGSYSLWDLSGSYTGFKYFTLSIGVKNIFNTNPPASDQSQAFQVGYDPTYADPHGSFFWSQIKFTWK
jgi:iron complex outermembrane recepter protein